MRSLLIASLFLWLLLPASSAPALEPDFTYQNLHGEIVQGVRCGTPEPGLGLDVAPTGRFDRDAWLTEKALVTIPVAFHVLTYYGNREGGIVGEVATEQIDQQIAILNAAYADAGFGFQLASIDYTEDKAWATMRPGSSDEMECKAALAVDITRTLNIYTAVPGGGLLGWSYFPEDFPEDDTIHGTVIHWESLPGSAQTWPYNLGDTATHEIGHYCGLYHTFQGGCAAPNDYCDDTPQEATASYGCPHDQDSCLEDPGLDPIYNFMDYTDDDCMDHFTTDQGLRMAEQMSLYRPTIMNSLAAIDGDHGPAALTRTQITGISPNPFNPMTGVSFYLEKAGRVRANVYDLAGRRVDTLVDESRGIGEHLVMFDGTGLPSAVYFVKLEAGEVTITRRMLLLK